MNFFVRIPNSPGTFCSSAFLISLLPGSACAAQDACVSIHHLVFLAGLCEFMGPGQLPEMIRGGVQFLSSEDEVRLWVTVHSPKGDLSVKPAGLSLHSFVHLQLHPYQQWVKPKAGSGLVSSSFTSSFISSQTVYSEYFSSHFATTTNSINII